VDIRKQRVEPRRVAALQCIVDRLAPLELVFEEILWQRRVGFRQRVDSLLRKQVLRAIDGVLERAIGLVYACGGLQCTRVCSAR
jgi:hypothetical protein